MKHQCQCGALGCTNATKKSKSFCKLHSSHQSSSATQTQQSPQQQSPQQQPRLPNPLPGQDNSAQSGAVMFTQQMTQHVVFVDPIYLASLQSENAKLREENTRLREQSSRLGQVEVDRLRFEAAAREAWEKVNELKQLNDELKEQNSILQRRVDILEQQHGRLAPMVAALDAAQALTFITDEFKKRTKLPGHLLWKEPVERDEYLQKYHTQEDRAAFDEYLAERPDLARKTVRDTYKKIVSIRTTVAHNKKMKHAEIPECRKVLMAAIDQEDKNEVDGVEGLVRLLEAVTY